MILFVITIITAFFLNAKIFENQAKCYLGSMEDSKLPEGSKIKFVPAYKYVERRTIGIQRKIPSFIYQTNQNDYVPIRMSLAVTSILQKNPDFSYRYFNATQRREFIRQYMGQTLLLVYDKQIPGTSKSNIFRYSIIFYYGGCYMDSGFVVAKSMSQLLEQHTQYLTVRDGDFYHFDSRVHSAFFCAIPGSPILQAVLNNITRTTAKQDFGTRDIEISGPLKLTHSFLRFVPESYRQNKVHAGYYRNGKVIIYQALNRQNNCQTVLFVDRVGQVIFSHRYPYYRSELLTVTGPSYTQFYNQRKTYNKSIHIYDVDDFNISNALIHGLRDYRIPLLLK